MKIGIVTFHRAHNCGAALQCLALVLVLRSLGHDVKVIDCNDIGDGLRIRFDGRRTVRGIASYCRSVIRAWLNVHRWRYWLFLRQNIPTTANVIGRPWPENFDRYILGSDQVLNPLIIRHFGKTFLLTELGCDEKKIAYAASFGVSTLLSEDREFYSTGLKRFASLSFREASAVSICRDELGIKNAVSVVVDPTLLLEAKSYIKYERKFKVVGEYVLVYTVGSSMDELQMLADQVANRYGIRVVFATLIFDKPKKAWVAVSPGELLYLVRNAKFVLTSSFHGTAFSVLNHKPFLSMISSTQTVNGRITDLLGKLGLDKQLVRSDIRIANVEIDDLFKIDYGSVDLKLDKMKADSLRYLTEAINAEG